MKGRDVFGLCLAAALASAIVISSVYNARADAQNILFGNAGLLPVAVTIGTLVFVVIGSRYAAETLAQSKRAERSVRFQKGVELLRADSPSSTVAGLSVLRSVSGDDPSAYRGHAIAAISFFCSESSATIVSSVPVADQIDGDIRKNRSSSLALSSLSMMNEYPTPWPANTLLREKRLLIQDVLIANAEKIGDKFSNIWFRRIALHNVRFERCDFRCATLEILLGTDVEFVECDFTDAEVSIVSHEFEKSSTMSKSRIRFIGGEMLRARFNGEDMAKFRAAP